MRYSISQEICTRFLLCCALLWLYIDWFSHIHQAYFTGTGAISSSKTTLMNIGKYFMWIHYERLHNHNKAKHNKTACIFLGIYCKVGIHWIQNMGACQRAGLKYIMLIRDATDVPINLTADDYKQKYVGIMPTGTPDIRLWPATRPLFARCFDAIRNWPRMAILLLYHLNPRLPLSICACVRMRVGGWETAYHRCVVKNFSEIYPVYKSKLVGNSGLRYLFDHNNPIRCLFPTKVVYFPRYQLRIGKISRKWRTRHMYMPIIPSGITK